MADLTKEQLHEAYQQIRVMANAFKACQDGAGVIAVLIQAEEQKSRMDAAVTRKRDELKSLAREVELDQKILADLQSDLDKESERLAAYRETELAKIARETAKEKASAEEHIASLAKDIQAAEEAHGSRMEELGAQHDILVLQIVEKKKVLEDLNADIAALKARLG